MLKKYLILLFIFASTIGNAQEWLWGVLPTYFYGGYAEPLTIANCAVTDEAANVYQISDVFDAIVFGKDTVFGGAGVEAPFIVKYDKYGNILWAQYGKRLDSYSGGHAVSIAYRKGAEYVAGDFSSNMAFGKDTLFSAGVPNMFLVKYTSGGAVVWGEEVTGVKLKGSVSAGSVAVNDSGDVFVTGFYYGTIAIGKDTLSQPKAGYQQAIFLIKYDSTGKLLWVRQSKAAVKGIYERGNSVLADNYGNAYITGFFTDTIGFGPYQLQDHGDTGSKQMFFVKYNSSGNVVWAKQTTGKLLSDNIIPQAIAMDAFGKLYISGTVQDTINFGNKTLAGGLKNNTSFLAKYDTAGNTIWLKLGTWSSYNVLYDLSLVVTDTLKQGAVGVLQAVGSGHYTFGDSTFAWKDTANNPTVGVVLQFDTAGNVLCGNTYCNGYSDVGGDGVAVDPIAQHVYLAGTIDYNRAGNIYGVDTLEVNYGHSTSFVLSWSPCCHVPLTMSLVDTIICQGNSVSITASGAISYYWLQTNKVYGDTASTILVKPTAQQNTYGVLGTKDGCSNIATAEITVNIPPKVYILPTHPVVCYGDSVFLSASGGGTYLWSIGATTSNITALPLTNPTVYTLTVKAGVCTVDTTATITVNPTPTVTVSFPKDDCSGTPVMLSANANGASTYQWTPIVYLSCTKCANPYANPPSTIPYTVTATNIYGCSATATDTLHVWPGFRVATDSTPETSPCNGSAGVTITGSTGPYTYIWSPGGQTNNSITGQCAGTYCCNITDKNGCSNSACIQITSSAGLENMKGAASGINIYPDPNTGYFNVTGLTPGQALILYNCLGQTIFTTIVNTSYNNMDISSQPSGIYLLMISNKDGSLAGEKKILKE